MDNSYLTCGFPYEYLSQDLPNFYPYHKIVEQKEFKLTQEEEKSHRTVKILNIQAEQDRPILANEEQKQRIKSPNLFLFFTNLGLRFFKIIGQSLEGYFFQKILFYLLCKMDNMRESPDFEINCEEIVQQIKNGDLEKALELTESFFETNSNFYNAEQLIHLQSRFNKIEREKIAGTIEDKDYRLIRSQVRDGLLKLLK